MSVRRTISLTCRCSTPVTVPVEIVYAKDYEALKEAAREVYLLCEGDYPAHSERGLSLERLRVLLEDKTVYTPTHERL
jgi:hypothetical protein